MIAGCGSQLQYAQFALPMGGSIMRPVALKFGTVLAMGEAMEADMALLARVLPGVEAAILTGGDDDLSEEEAENG
ncbi:DUF7697 family protein [Sphingomonas bacterium]|uniref:DUF7697 family protein n=1 Tax=Sphingomonas bacterium TaxID=1895847 RepID=UPI001576B893|nr:hypothetical protein [Sphingomonas bacterium]